LGQLAQATVTFFPRPAPRTSSGGRAGGASGRLLSPVAFGRTDAAAAGEASRAARLGERSSARGPPLPPGQGSRSRLLGWRAHERRAAAAAANMAALWGLARRANGAGRPLCSARRVEGDKRAREGGLDQAATG